MKTEIIHVPDLGGAEEVEVIEVCVSAGDQVAPEQSLIVLESDKASMEVPSPVAGKVVAVLLKAGANVREGDPILELELAGAAADAQATPSTDSSTVAAAEGGVSSDEAVVPGADRAGAAAAVISATEDVSVPDLGEAESVDLIEICVAVGDEVAEGDSLIVLESDKASMEIPSPSAGTVTAIALKPGAKVSAGDRILTLSVTGSTTAQPAVPEAASPAAGQDAQPSAGGNGALSETAGEAMVSAEQTVLVPDIGDSEKADVIEVCVAVGDVIDKDDSLIVLESDKASMEIPSPYSGKVSAVALKVGDRVATGSEILRLTVKGEQRKPVSQAQAEAAPSASSDSPSAGPGPAAQVDKAPRQTGVPSRTQASAGADVYAGPSVRQLARELGVDLRKVQGSGPRQRILKDDLNAFVKQALAAPPKAEVAGSAVPPIPDQDFSQYGAVRIEKLSKLNQLTANNMQRAWLNVPHVTQFDDVDVTELEDFRKGLADEAARRGVKLTPLPFLLKACALALREHPKFNVSLLADRERIVFKEYVHIGMAVDTPAGLVVPVLRDVDRKSIWELAAETAELAEKAKQRKLTPDEMRGGCFSISSLGNIGGRGFTPIVNAPEVGILGVSRLSVQPHWTGSEFVPRKLLPLSLSYDHRAVNGADAGRFMTYLTALLSDVRRMVL